MQRRAEASRVEATVLWRLRRKLGRMRITSITPMKNEAPFILEWVAYHRLIGVNDIIVFSNDCTDGTDLMLERLDELGLLRHYPNPCMTTNLPKPHLQAMRYINSSQRLRRSDWVVSLDVDEFIRVNVGEGHLEDLFNAVPDANMICMNQLNFGHGGVEAFKDELLLNQFEYCWDYTNPYHRDINRRGVKTFTHASSKPKSWNNHSPVFARKEAEQVRCFNGNGIRLTDQNFRKDIKSLTAPEYGYDLVQLNHYALRARDTFLLKVHRGNANFGHEEKDAQQIVSSQMKYWRRYDNNHQHDVRIQSMADDATTARTELLKDPELRQLHMAAVSNAQERIAEMKQDDGMDALLTRIQRHIDRNPIGIR